jgi:hypothetical protein
MRTANAVAIAGGALVAILLEKLIERGALTPADAQSICAEAQKSLLPYTGNGGDAVEGARIISEINSRFAKGGP